MNTGAWRRRLKAQLSGWHVWTTGGSLVGERWNAVPAPTGTTLIDACRMSGRISAETPAALRALAQERYGWHDACESCGVPARECGHRQPEREGARRTT